MTEQLSINLPDDVAADLRRAVPESQRDEFVAEQIKRGLAEQNLRPLDDAIAHIAQHDKPLLDRLGNVR